MILTADNDVIGAVERIRRFLESNEWHEFTTSLDIAFVDFEALNLRPESRDEDVWHACQEERVILITGNRSGGADSLDDVIRVLER
jgi:hypothetical protein